MANWVQDGLAALALLVSVLGAMMTWLWKHSTRLTRVETRIDGYVDIIADIRALLVRIEHKLDGKVNRSELENRR